MDDDYRVQSNAVEIFKDTSNWIIFSNIINHPQQYPFIEGGKEEQFSYDTKSTYWVRFKIQNHTSTSDHWIV